MPITTHLSCTEPLDEFESLSYHHTNHAKAYVSGLIAASNKTIEGIANHVMPLGSERALNKFLGEYDWDEEALNLERLDHLQKYGETRWPRKGYVVILTRYNVWVSKQTNKRLLTNSLTSEGGKRQ